MRNCGADRSSARKPNDEALILNLTVFTGSLLKNLQTSKCLFTGIYQPFSVHSAFIQRSFSVFSAPIQRPVHRHFIDTLSSFSKHSAITASRKPLCAHGSCRELTEGFRKLTHHISMAFDPEPRRSAVPAVQWYTRYSGTAGTAYSSCWPMCVCCTAGVPGVPSVPVQQVQQVQWYSNCLSEPGLCVRRNHSRSSPSTI